MREVVIEVKGTDVWVARQPYDVRIIIRNVDTGKRAVFDVYPVSASEEDQ